MTIYELLQAPLMRGAKVIAGHTGLHREVSWAAPDSDIDFDQWIMPGLLLLYTSALEETPWSEMSGKIEKANPSGIILFSNTLTELMSYVIEVQMFSYYNEKKMPLILLPRGANILDFSKRFFSLISAQFTTEYCREEWLRELIYYGKSHELGTTVKSYGYSTQCNYICLLISLSEASYSHSIQLEMDLHSARNFLNRMLTIETTPILSFIDFPSMVIFVPWPKHSDMIDFKKYLTPILLRLNHELLQHDWNASIGTLAYTLSDFQASYLHAQETANITEALQTQEQIHFYNDWYMHLLLLHGPKHLLHEQVEFLLDPILAEPELIDTLNSYLNHSENLKATAEHLFLHVNTLKYRLQRISELLHCDLKDPDTRFRLRMALTALYYLRNST